MSENTTDNKKFLGLKGLKLVLGNLKEKYSPLVHTHDDLYYTETEVDELLLDLKDGNTVVAKAEEATHATNADKATNAEHSDEATHAINADNAINAENATKATQDASGNVITDTYETKEDAAAKLAEAKEYTNTEIANLVNSAPETLDTLGELAIAFEENQDVVEALDAAISTKQDKNLVVTITSTTTDDGTVTYSADKTFEEISTACNNETNVYAKYNNVIYDFLKLTKTNVWFNSYSPGSMLYQRIIIGTDNSVNYSIENVIAKEYTYGGIKASAKTDTDIVEAKIGDDGKLYVPEYPIQVRSDWNESDETALSFIKNKPFGEEKVLATIVPETTVVINSSNTSNNNLGVFSYLEENKTYVVKFNGIDYVCECRTTDISGEGDYYYIIGNGSYDRGDYGIMSDGIGNNEPFQICQRLGSESTEKIYIHAEDGEYTVSIHEVQGGIKQLDEKFIPDTIARTDHVHSWDSLEDKPFYDLSDKVILIPETTNSSHSANGAIAYDSTALDWTLGNKVYVVFDGIKYEATCIENNDTFYEYRFYTNENSYIGFWENNSIYSHDREFDFSIGVEHTFEVYTEDIVIKQLDEKFIPDTIATKEYVDEHILSKEEVITLLTETGFISPATTTSGDIYTDSDGDIYVM